MGPWAEQLEFVKWSKIEALFSPDAPRTKLMAGAELCWSRDKRSAHEVRENSPTAHAQEGSSGSKTRARHPIISVVKPPTGLCSGIHLGKKAAYTYWAGGGGRWKGGSQNRAGVGKELKSLAKGKQRSSRTALYIHDLMASLPHSSSLGRAPIPLLSGLYFCLASVLNKHNVSLCATLLYCISDNKLCTCFYGFCLFEKFLFQTQQARGELYF